MTDIPDATPDAVRGMRIAAGLTQSQCAVRFGYTLRGWQQKETPGANGRRLTRGEWELLLLLAGQHPELALKSSSSKRDRTPFAPII